MPLMKYSAGEVSRMRSLMTRKKDYRFFKKCSSSLFIIPMPRIFSRWTPCLALTFLLLANFSQAATLTSSVDRTTIAENETFTLHVTYDDDPEDMEIDAALLQQQFKVANSNKTSSIQILNGHANRSTSWYFELAPRTTGNLLIPSFSINNTFSEAITIVVTAAPKAIINTNQNFYSEADIDKKQVHVQEQIIVTWRLASSLPISNPVMAEPKIDNVVVHNLGVHQYQRSSANGKIEMVLEQRFALFPQKSGTLTIPSQKFQFVATNERRLQNGFIRNVQQKRIIATDEQTISVLPADTAGNKAWLPALKLSIAQDFNGLHADGTATVGEAFTRIITLRAIGLTAEQLPSPELDVASFKTYKDKPEFQNDSSDKGVLGVRAEKVTMIPSQAGIMTLPALQVPWYNTTTAQWETAQVPARDIVVSPGKTAQANTIPSTNASPTNSPLKNPTSTDINTPGANNTQSQPPDDALPHKILGFSRKTIFVIGLLTAALMLLLVKLYLMQRQLNALQTADFLPDRVSPTNAIKKHSDTLIQAANTEDQTVFYKSVLDWAAQNWQTNPPHTLKEIASRVDDETLRQHLLSLDASLYGAKPVTSSLVDIAIALQKQNKPEIALATERKQLEDLYRS